MPRLFSSLFRNTFLTESGTQARRTANALLEGIAAQLGFDRGCAVPVASNKGYIKKAIFHITQLFGLHGPARLPARPERELLSEAFPDPEDSRTPGPA